MVKEYANAKINLFLDVTSKREDGFHNIKSVMHTVTLCDTLLVSAAYSNNTDIAIVTNSLELTTDENNLIYISAAKYLAKFKINARVQIELDKKIPIGAGLGGGSSDAAATLRALNRIFGFATREELLKIAAEIGSDVPFCLLGGTSLCEGRGDVITPISPPKTMHFVIAIGKERVSTPAAYRDLDDHYCNKFTPVESISSVYNIFEHVIKISEIEKIKEILKKCGAESTLMSGSGPSVFGTFASEAVAKYAQTELLNLGYEAYYATSAPYGENI